MEKATLISKIKNLINTAEIESAIAITESWLAPQSEYQRLHKLAINIQSKFAQFKIDQQRGILSFEQKTLAENRIRTELLQLLTYIEKNNLNPKPAIKKTNWVLIAGICMGIILASIALFILHDEHEPKEKTPEKQKEETEKDCPECESDTLFQILILPFHNPADDGLSPQGLIKERLNELLENEASATCIKINENFKPDSYLSRKEATDAGKACNAEIIIWGRAEKTPSGKQVKTGFQFLGKKQGLAFEELRWENEVKNLQTISEIASGGELTDDIEALIGLIFGLTLEQKGEIDTAIEVIEKVEIPVTDSAAILVKNMVAADLQLKKGDTEAAAKSLNTVLETHPNYWLARNNRAVLNMQNENYLDAADDFTKVLEVRSKDTLAILEARGTAYLKADQLKNAEKDFEKVLELKPQKSTTIEKLKRTRVEIKKQEDIILKSDIEIRKNPNNTEAYNKKATAARKLGQYNLAEETIQLAKVRNGFVPEIYVTQFEIAAAKGSSEDATAILKEAKIKGINTNLILNNEGVLKAMKSRRTRQFKNIQMEEN